eukprot:SM000039S14517  [mRNA]  locus=s39:563761:566662:- [translate_table: standard]
MALNGWVYAVGSRHKWLLRAWYIAGSVAGVLAMIGIMLGLLWEIVWSLPAPPTSQSGASPAPPARIFTPVIPGVTLPWGEMGYMWWAMASSMAVHEVGHGLAAASEGVRMQHVAVFVALVFPGALVALSADQLELLPPTKALRIYCAGVWHNLVQKHASGTWLIKQEASSLLRLPVTGIAWMQVVSVPKGSPMAGHLESGDLVTAVDGIAITSGEAWLRCLTAHQEQQHVDGVRTPANESSALGYCVPASLLSSFPSATFLDLQAVGDRSPSNMGRLHSAVEPCGPLELAFRQVDHSVGLDTSSLIVIGQSPQNLAMIQTPGALQGACLRPRDVAAFSSCQSRRKDGEEGPTWLNLHAAYLGKWETSMEDHIDKDCLLALCGQLEHH